MAVDFNKSGVRGQILTEAKTYEPATYQVLKFMSALELVPDELSGQFIPITSVQPLRPDETQIFAVGIMPPSVAVTGRLVDRAASVRVGGNLLDDEGKPIPFNEIENINEPLSVDQSGVPSVVGSGVPSVGSGGPVLAPADEERLFWKEFVLMCNRLGVKPEDLAMVIKTESNWRPQSGGDKENKFAAKGLYQLTADTALGEIGSGKPGIIGLRNDPVAEAAFQDITNQTKRQQLPLMEKFYNPRNRAKSTIWGKNDEEIKLKTFGDWSRPNANNPEAPGALFTNLGNASPKQKKAFKSNEETHDKNKDGIITKSELLEKYKKKRNLSGTLKALIERGIRDAGEGWKPTPIVADSEPTEYAGDGAKNANEHRRILAKTANTAINQTELGRAYGAAQAQQASEMRDALKAIADLPPLRLLVNPQSFRQSNEKVVVDNWGRNGPITEHWGDNQDKIEGSGKIGAFYSLDIKAQDDRTAGAVGSSPGLGRIARQFSKSYQNLLALWMIYKNNGGVWFPDATDSSSHVRNNLSVIGSVYLYFDNILYIGSFDSFNLSEADDQPFTLEYSFAFTVRAQFMLDNLENQAGTYGAPALFTPRRGETTPVQPQRSAPMPVLGGAASPPGADAVNTPSAVPGPPPERFVVGRTLGSAANFDPTEVSSVDPLGDL